MRSAGGQGLGMARRHFAGGRGRGQRKRPRMARGGKEARIPLCRGRAPTGISGRVRRRRRGAPGGPGRAKNEATAAAPPDLRRPFSSRAGNRRPNLVCARMQKFTDAHRCPSLVCVGLRQFTDANRCPSVVCAWPHQSTAANRCSSL
eukprot:7898032-Pyramimonas_sp.AAC.1